MDAGLGDSYIFYTVLANQRRVTPSRGTPGRASWPAGSPFSSKRRGGLFTRCYLSFVDETGRAHKPFLVPQRDPEFYDSLLKTVSVPELITGPVPVTAEILTQAVVSDQAIEVDAITGATKPAGREEPWQPSRE